ncbi:MAG: class I SAM-dependent methyltransferase [Ilumatobacteraceae bacterium]
MTTLRTEPRLGDFVNPSSFWQPLRFVHPHGWVGHIPFAFWLVDALRPSTIVELGTHSGNSYSAFCQAVSTLGFDSRCVAVDTWKGDEHAGFYGNDVYDDLKRFNDDRFSSFSELMQCTFDEASASFEDGSIDLLHIDGMHTYDAVRHDYERWLPKMSERGVVVMHDIAVFENGFGVHNLWEEIAGRLPSFEFVHGHGLGVIGVGTKQEPAVAALFAASTDRELVGHIRNAYARLGESVSGSTGRTRASTAEIDRFNEENLDLKLRLWSIRDHVIGAEATAGRLAAEVTALEAEKSAILRSVRMRVGAKIVGPLARVARLLRRLPR